MENKGQQYKTPFITWMGTKCFLYVNDPETIGTIFNSSYCINKGEFYRFMATVIGDGLFTSRSPRWNKHRRLINPAFNRQSINSFLPIFNQETNVLLKTLIKVQRQPLEIYEILKRSVLETACQTTMGKRMNFQENGSAAIFNSYNGLTDVCIKRMLSPWLYPDIVYVFSSLFKRQQKYVSVLCKFVDNLLQISDNVKNSRDEVINNDCLTQYSKKVFHQESGFKKNCKTKDKNSNKNNPKVFIQHIRKYIKGGILTWKDARDEANVIVAATFETTSTALYMVCLCLAMHPEYQEKVYNELAHIFPSTTQQPSHSSNKINQQAKDNSNLILNDITLEDLDRMTFTEMVINEAMRLFAPVPIVLRQASSDFKLHNITIPKGTQIGIDIFNMQRSKNVWGRYACEFKPDVHFAPNHKYHSFAFIPFTKGLRMCIGYRYALILMKIMVAKLFRNFKINANAKIDDLNVKGTISLKLRQYPLCVLEQRKPCKHDKITF
ncbi:cytochrome P450 313b1 isoform 2-T2 [Cochliomyia hominivorax]